MVFNGIYKLGTGAFFVNASSLCARNLVCVSFTHRIGVKGKERRDKIALRRLGGDSRLKSSLARC